MRASTRDSMKYERYCGKPRLGNHSFPIHSWFMSPYASVCCHRREELEQISMAALNWLEILREHTYEKYDENMSISIVLYLFKMYGSYFVFGGLII